jgi:alpha-ketoglutaric semialdehyde dehydrogenase
MSSIVNTVAESAFNSFLIYRNTAAKIRAELLRRIGTAIDLQRAELITIASAETHLPRERLNGEVSRTVNQSFLFAELLLEGSWVRAIIDHALPDRRPLPRPDLRQMQIALGPVAVFGASNFPFAYSVFGGDTVAALAAGCPVVYKVNPGHPLTSDAVADIIYEAIKELKLPAGVFSHIHSEGYEQGIELVTHPKIKAVGFTGSLKGGRAIFDAACRRDEPIPVYAEMGSTNPVFILPGILKEKYDELANSLWTSNTSSVGQFCTNPGIMITPKSEAADNFRNLFAQKIATTGPEVMLNTSIAKNFDKSVAHMSSKSSVNTLSSSERSEDGKTGSFAFLTNASDFLRDEELSEEMFGPASLQVIAENEEDLYKIAEKLPGQITASVWGNDEDLSTYKNLVSYLQLKAGRIIINGVPTGVEVSPAMNHGGPYPATTDSKFTSVGTQSIYRFTRPMCFQNFPEQLLPAELRDENDLGIWRMVDGKMTH